MPRAGSTQAHVEVKRLRTFWPSSAWTLVQSTREMKRHDEKVCQASDSSTPARCDNYLALSPCIYAMSLGPNPVSMPSALSNQCSPPPTMPFLLKRRRKSPC